ncbi:hypothetical protein EYF80_031596 [Liparis tanakae]|uniref:Uncharacterized protein n=1 Tax=Liparis tanakae TaxID=230148 RepID=A0A4Z2GZF9_9TELE|nr:hypothetical protein EYF80_031596 [Liparis tanakae]
MLLLGSSVVSASDLSEVFSGDRSFRSLWPAFRWWRRRRRRLTGNAGSLTNIKQDNEPPGADGRTAAMKDNGDVDGGKKRRRRYGTMDEQ